MPNHVHLHILPEVSGGNCALAERLDRTPPRFHFLIPGCEHLGANSKVWALCVTCQSPHPRT